VKNYQEEIKNLIDHLGDWFLEDSIAESGKMSKKLYPYEKLFSPIRINTITVKNRLVMGPMGNISMADEMGRPSAKMITYFKERARGGVGLITTGLIPVSQYIDPSVTEPGDRSYFPRIDKSRTVFSGWRDIAEAVHAYDSKIFIQLTPGLGRVGSPECLIKKFQLPVSASWNPNFYIPEIPCRPLSDRALWKIIKNAGQAAANAKVSLIDGVYLHGHEGYLLEQLTNPAFNRRVLGKFKDYQAFGIEIVKEIRRRVGPDYPVMYRIDLSLALNETYGEKMNAAKSLRKFKHGRTVEQTLQYMANLVKAGVDIFDVDLGSYDNWWLPHPPTSMPPGCFLTVAKIAKDYFEENGIKSNKGLDVLVVAVGKLGYPDLAERALREEFCDLVMLARPLLADPDWPNKAYAGKVADIIPCMGDQEGCINEFVEGGHPQCSVNPRTGNEDIYPEVAHDVARPKRVAVVGAGPAGVIAATTLAKRGHNVTLFEKSNRVGGMLIPGSRPKMKCDVLNYVEYLKHLVESTLKECSLEVILDTEVDASKLQEIAFDAVITATGGAPQSLNVEGINSPNVIQAVDLLNNPEIAKSYKDILIVGGGAVGCETAYFLAYELDKKVTVIEMLPYFMKGVCTANRGYIIHYLERKGAKLMNLTKLTSIQDGFVSVLKNTSKNAPNPYEAWKPILPENIKNPFDKKIEQKEEVFELKADLVVIAVGLRPKNDLYYECLKNRVAEKIYNIGDSSSPARVFEAVKAGFLVGTSI
jgi:2-enoate reductase